MTPKQILTDMKGLLKGPESWTQGADARNAKGHPIPPWREDVVCLCLLGAKKRASTLGTQYGAGFKVEELLDEAVRKLTGSKVSFVAYNDTPGRTYSEVVHLLDVAIALAE
jgi:hypothetical protein